MQICTIRSDSNRDEKDQLLFHGIIEVRTNLIQDQVHHVIGMSPKEVVDVVVGCLYHKALHPTVENHDGYRRGRITMTERQMKIDLIGKLESIFEVFSLFTFIISLVGITME